ncbi:ribonuclease H [Saccharibacillus sp. O23]|uniref:ribonuclease H n=1 Tax=Saccharibacillus sp. O23 TaxID=2009338 RepID=UPI000B4E24FF|nr:ribonuclease H family protein [Saccharibacillus sp. O23]OWR29576.1 ribonuclease H [Saccharibacillus sp. O23]
MSKSKFYVVWAGKQPGIYSTWADCKAQVDGFPGARYKSFESRSEAEAAYAGGAKPYIRSGGAGKAKKPAASRAGAKSADLIDYNSISVDVGTRGNPGPVEYKGVDTATGEVIFSYGPIAKGTNNLGEFLAIVHALAHIQREGSDKSVYSDSVNAMKWVKQRRVSSTLPRDRSTEEIWTLVDRAVQWLETHPYTTKIMKWETKDWGEIKADYGRK